MLTFRIVLNRSKDLWIPAIFNSKKVDVQIEISFNFFTADKYKMAIDYGEKADKAIKNLDYTTALEYYRLSLEKVSNNYRSIYYKAICEMKLGDNASSCKDLEKVNSYGLMDVDELIEKTCKEK